MNKPHAYLFVDGSCGVNDDYGGWAGIAVAANGVRKLFVGSECPTTISRCELQPILEGVNWIYKNWAKRVVGFRLNIYSDSDYTVKTLNGLYQVSKNQDLWAAATEMKTWPIRYQFNWVGRNSLPYMEMCDGIAGAMRHSGIEAARRMFALQEYRDMDKMLPVESLPTDDNQTQIPEDILCLAKQQRGESPTPLTPS